MLTMGTIIHAFKKCCPPDPVQNQNPGRASAQPSSGRVYPRRSFSINSKLDGDELYELYEIVDVPEWGWTQERPTDVPSSARY